MVDLAVVVNGSFLATFLVAEVLGEEQLDRLIDSQVTSAVGGPSGWSVGDLGDEPAANSRFAAASVVA